MSRVIKFRLWDSNQGIMWDAGLDDFDDGLHTSALVHYDDPGVVVMQFTGLHDKNGKEIYEGDILSDEESQKFKWRIEFRGGAFLAICPTKPTLNSGLIGPIMAGRERAKMPLVVIGNIYEHPDLLNQED